MVQKKKTISFLRMKVRYFLPVEIDDPVVSLVISNVGFLPFKSRSSFLLGLNFQLLNVTDFLALLLKSANFLLQCFSRNMKLSPRLRVKTEHYHQMCNKTLVNAM